MNWFVFGIFTFHLFTQLAITGPFESQYVHVRLVPLEILKLHDQVHFAFMSKVIFRNKSILMK